MCVATGQIQGPEVGTKLTVSPQKGQHLSGGVWDCAQTKIRVGKLCRVGRLMVTNVWLLGSGLGTCPKGIVQRVPKVSINR